MSRKQTPEHIAKRVLTRKLRGSYIELNKGHKSTNTKKNSRKIIFLVSLSLFLFLFSLTYIRAESFGYDTVKINSSFGYDSDEDKINVNNYHVNDTNVSDYWNVGVGTLDNANATQFDSGDGDTLNILETWFTTLWNSIFGAKTTDDLSEGSTNLYDNSTWNQSHADDLYWDIDLGSYNETYANNLDTNETDRVNVLNQTIIDSNTSWLLDTSYNATYDSFKNNVSYGDIFVNESGDTMSGNLNGGGNNLTDWDYLILNTLNFDDDGAGAGDGFGEIWMADNGFIVRAPNGGSVRLNITTGGNIYTSGDIDSDGSLIVDDLTIRKTRMIPYLVTTITDEGLVIYDNTPDNNTMINFTIDGNGVFEGNVTVDWLKGNYGNFTNVCIGSDCISDWSLLNQTDLVLSINTTANIQNLLNDTGIYSTYNSTYAGYSNFGDIFVNESGDEISGGLNVSHSVSMATTGGNVGIGTTSPSALLDISGEDSLRISHSATGPIFEIANLDTTVADEQTLSTINFTTNDASNPSATAGFIKLEGEGTAGLGAITFGTGITATERMRIDNAGNVGIGTTTPDYNLEVYDSTHAQIGISGDTTSQLLFNGTDDRFIYRQSDGDLDLELGGGAVVTFEDGGNVGIGTTGPQDILHIDVNGGKNTVLSNTGGVSNDEDLGGVIWKFNDGTGNEAGRIWIRGNSDSGTTGKTRLSLGAHANAGGTTGEKLTIQSTGNVGIGTTKPTHTLNVKGYANITELGAASATAVCWDGGVLTTCSSALKYKENIINMTATTGIWEKYMKLQPVEFNFKNDTKIHLGLIAEQVYDLFPRHVFNFTRPIYEEQTNEVCEDVFNEETNETTQECHDETTQVQVGEVNEIEGIEYSSLTTANTMMIQDLKKELDMIKNETCAKTDINWSWCE